MSDISQIRSALAEAHLPTLLMSLVHLTGDTGLLAEEFRPNYAPFADEREGGYSPETQARLRELAEAALVAHIDAGRRLLAAPSEATLRRMLDFIAGASVPDSYVPMLVEELSLDGQDARRPQWEASKLRDAAAGMRVLVIGAGMSGVLAGIRLQQAGIAFEILEKNANVGGTWWENTYPGCRVDNPSHLYSYSFEPNHDWPLHFSPQPVLQDYFRACADKHGLTEKIRFQTEVVRAVFDETQSAWRVTVRKPDGAEETLTADAVISAVGQLNQPQFPSIPGRERFEGVAFHSARWDHDAPLEGRVAVIGTGASACQFVPEIAPKVGELKVFQRTPPWLGFTANYHSPVTSGELWLFEHVPFYEKWYRFRLFWALTEGALALMKRDPAYDGPPDAVSAGNAQMRDMLRELMRRQLEAAPELLEKVVPRYPPGGKRIVRDNGSWLGALQRPNVELVTDEIVEITPKGVRTGDGREHPVDTLIYGTGFCASQFLRTFEVVGRGGAELHDRWSGDARAYLGVMAPDFPNFFMLYGPNTNLVANGSIIFMSECAVTFIMGVLQRLAAEGARTAEVTAGAHDAYNRMIDQANEEMAWAAPQVTSWYKNAKGRVSQNWPLRLIDYWEATRSPDPDALAIR